MKPYPDFKTISQTEDLALTKTEFAEMFAGLLTSLEFLLFVFAAFYSQAWWWLPALMIIIIAFILPSILLVAATYWHVYRQSRNGFYAMFLLASYLSLIQIFPLVTGGSEAKRYPYLAATSVSLTLTTFILGTVNSRNNKAG